MRQTRQNAEREELDPEEASAALRLYQLLIAGYQRLAGGNPPSTDDIPRFESLLTGYARAIESDRQTQEATAADFNLLDVLRITGNENRHSMALAWLLDCNHRKYGTHAQGTLGFDLFLREVGLPAEYAQSAYWVRREVAGEESRVDVEIGARGDFLIHIENKIWAGEGPAQTDREWADVLRRAAMLSIGPESGRVHALFLTPGGVAPLNAGFVPVSWRQIATVLDDFAQRSKPADVRLFAAHYARALRRFIVREERKGEEDNG